MKLLSIFHIIDLLLLCTGAISCVLHEKIPNQWKYLPTGCVWRYPLIGSVIGQWVMIVADMIWFPNANNCSFFFAIVNCAVWTYLYYLITNRLKTMTIFTLLRSKDWLVATEKDSRLTELEMDGISIFTAKQIVNILDNCIDDTLRSNAAVKETNDIINVNPEQNN
jgi:hypothetical protein